HISPFVAIFVLVSDQGLSCVKTSRESPWELRFPYKQRLCRRLAAAQVLGNHTVSHANGSCARPRPCQSGRRDEGGDQKCHAELLLQGTEQPYDGQHSPS